jgi:hypothetical protein
VLLRFFAQQHAQCALRSLRSLCAVLRIAKPNEITLLFGLLKRQYIRTNFSAISVVVLVNVW